MNNEQMKVTEPTIEELVAISAYAEIEQDGDAFLVYNLVTGLLVAEFKTLSEAWVAARGIFHRYEAMEA